MVMAMIPAVFAADGDFVIRNGVLEKYNGPGGDVVIPNGVTSIGESAFEFCDSLTSVTIPDGVTGIGDKAFWGCDSLTSVVIPGGVTSIGDLAFAGCGSLLAINVNGSNQYYTSVDGVLFSKDMATLYQYPIGKSAKEYQIPNGVTSIGISAFEGCDSLTSVAIPNGVICIGTWAFMDCCSLTSVIIPDSVTSVGGQAFDACGSLTSVTVMNADTDIGDDAFGYNDDEPVPGFTLFGCAGSTAQTYAGKNGLTFVSLD